MNQMLLTNEFIDSFVFSQERRQDTREKIENKSRNNNKKTLSPSTDTLFWCLYYIITNNSKDTIKNTFIEEKQKKYEWVLKLQTNRALYKKHSKSEPFFSLHNKFSISAVHALCELFSLTVTIIIDKTYIRFEYGSNNDNFLIIYDITTNTFSLNNNLDSYGINNVSKTHLHIVDYKKTLYAMSHYKIDELKTFMNKLGMNTDKSLKKQEIYDNVKNKIKLTYLKINI